MKRKVMEKTPKYLLLCILMAAFVALSGCGGSGDSGSDGATEPSGESAETDSSSEGDATSDGITPLSLEQIIDIVNTSDSVQVYKDSTMDEEVAAVPQEEIQLTDDEIAKIKEMKLKIGMEFGQMSDPTRWEVAGIESAAKELGITVGETWIAEDVDSQIKDYQNFKTVANDYDALFTIPLDVSLCGEALKEIMKTTDIGYMCSVPYNLDWNDAHFAGCSDANALQAGVYSAKAIATELGGKGTIAEIGYKAGKEGTFASCYNRYLGWDQAFKDYPDIKIVDKWYDDPADVKPIVESLLASNPDIIGVLVDWANTPGNETQQVLADLGLTPWKDITMVTIDYDDAISVPMALNGPDNNYTSAFVAQAWYTVGVNSVKLYAKHLLYGNEAPKYVTCPPFPIATYNNVKTVYETASPDPSSMPPEIADLKDQWELGVEDVWH
jgi:ABC-type sugar transport system substrate-binding protein